MPSYTSEKTGSQVTGRNSCGRIRLLDYHAVLSVTSICIECALRRRPTVSTSKATRMDDGLHGLESSGEDEEDIESNSS